MFYENIIILLILCSVSFGNGITINLNHIKHKFLFKLLLFCLLIISSRAALYAGNTAYNLSKEYVFYFISFIISFFSGIVIIYNGIFFKKAVYILTWNKLNEILYICAYTFLIIFTSSVNNIYNKCCVFISAAEFILFCIGVNIGKNMEISSRKYNKNIWRILSGIFALITAFIYISFIF